MFLGGGDLVGGGGPTLTCDFQVATSNTSWFRNQISAAELLIEMFIFIYCSVPPGLQSWRPSGRQGEVISLEWVLSLQSVERLQEPQLSPFSWGEGGCHPLSPFLFGRVSASNTLSTTDMLHKCVFSPCSWGDEFQAGGLALNRFICESDASFRIFASPYLGVSTKLQF